MEMTVSAQGQLVLDEKCLSHLGVQPGDKIHVDATEHGIVLRAPVRPKARSRMIQGFERLRAGRVFAPATVEEINATIAAGYAGLLDDDGDADHHAPHDG